MANRNAFRIPAEFTQHLIRRGLSEMNSHAAARGDKIILAKWPDVAIPKLPAATVLDAVCRTVLLLVAKTMLERLPVETFTPKVLHDLYVALSNERQREFLEMVARTSTAEVPFLMAGQMDAQEMKRFSDMVEESLARQFFPGLLHEARKLARDKPQLSDEDFEKLLNDRMVSAHARLTRDISELEAASLKEHRDRKPEPSVVKRNVEICDLRKADKKTWSQGRLAKKFDITPRRIRSILAEEEKWRRLDAKGRTN
jgi:hypothetical protein